MSYQTDFVCTYKQMSDEISQETLYRIQLLQALGLETWDDEKVIVILNNTYDKIKDITVFRNIFKKAKKNKDLEFLLALICASTNENIKEEVDDCNDKLVFQLLFKYEYFDLFHRCLSEQLRNGRVEDKIVGSIIDILS